MLWVDPADPSVFAAVTGAEVTEPPADEDIAVVRQAVAVASEVLTLATAHLVHPAGEQTEEYIAATVRRLSLLHGPVTEVVSVSRVAPDGTETPVTGWRRVGGTILLSSGSRSETPLWRTNGVSGSDQTIHRVVYRMGSTVTTAARNAVLEYARQIWLSLQGSDECRLPDRTTSVVREGIGIELLTPQDFLDRGRTGLPQVDIWLAQANPKRALRPSAVYTPDSPPGVGVRLRRV